MEHNSKDVAIRIIMALAKDKVRPDVGLASLAIALVLCAKERGFTDEEMVEIFKTNIERINKDMSRQ